MINRGLYNEIIEKIQIIHSHHSGCGLEGSLDKVIDTRDNFDIKLMFVGHFSAGKSSLLNAFMEKPEFLKEAQEPQTAIATELIYDEIETSYSYDLNGKKEVLEINKQYNSNQYNHLEYRLNVQSLKQVSDFTIVDTPGFDAGIEVHTKALANYIGIGSAYLVVIDQEKGGIDQTTLDFIQEISNYSSQIAILINKCDKITEEVAESIAESARFTLFTHGLPYKVYTVSKRERNISEKLISIISSFDAQVAFNKVLSKQIKTELVNTEKILSITKNRIFLDTFDLDSDIATYSRLKEEIFNTFERKKEEEKDNLDNVVQEVSNQIRAILISRADAVAEALLSGNQVAAEAIIVETVRPIMLSTMKDISTRQIDDITSMLDFTGVVDEFDGLDLKEVAVNLAGNIKDLIEQGNFEKKTASEIEDVNKKKNIYRVVTGIAAIATNVIAPWLEVVIILLPDAINLLRGLLCENDNRLVKRRFINNVVPQIVNRIYPQLKKNIENTTELVLEEYERMFSEKIETIKNNIIEAQNKKDKKKDDFEKYKACICDDIEEIKSIINEMR